MGAGIWRRSSKRPTSLHLATNGPDGNPRVRPIWFCYANGAFWFTTRLEARPPGADVANGAAEPSRSAIALHGDDTRFAPSKLKSQTPGVCILHPSSWVGEALAVPSGAWVMMGNLTPRSTSGLNPAK